MSPASLHFANCEFRSYESFVHRSCTHHFRVIVVSRKGVRPPCQKLITKRILIVFASFLHPISSFVHNILVQKLIFFMGGGGCRHGNPNFPLNHFLASGRNPNVIRLYIVSARLCTHHSLLKMPSTCMKMFQPLSHAEN